MELKLGEAAKAGVQLFVKAAKAEGRGVKVNIGTGF